ncbi:MAG: dimethylargininase [Planctomycetota bacterium]|nr:MAG: dimethylargininase [Planctomycetota bacterium]
MLTVLARAPGPRFAEAGALDLVLARAQHAALLELLHSLGARVELAVEAPEASPYSCCVGDLAVDLGELVVLGRPAHAQRHVELAWVAAVLGACRGAAAPPLIRIEAPATLEGPDVLGEEDFVYVGQSPRTNHAGLKQLAIALLAHGKLVKAVEVRRALHLSNACAPIGDGAWLVHAAQLNLSRLRGLDAIEAPAGEPQAPALLALPGALIVPASAPRTLEALAGRGLAVHLCDVSEFERAGVSLRSLVLPIGR